MGEGIVGMWSEERGEHLMVRVFSLHAEDGERLTASVWLISVFELWEYLRDWERECLRDWESVWETKKESAWETERVFERLRETVWVGVWNLHVAKIFHISRLANRVKRVLKARVSIESRVFKTRDAINIFCFKTEQLTILLDTLCYLARGFLFSSTDKWVGRCILTHFLTFAGFIRFWAGVEMLVSWRGFGSMGSQSKEARPPMVLRRRTNNHLPDEIVFEILARLPKI